ncbi:smoothelin isoform X2 [Malaclemys terrapin pileata]|uniref:smoothelin isoform X2 n=1 Tax=Malaclemys terrapin pileata TaxID=2991368 RepID=UPI0023A8CCE8|nr:smoothelin isoform X2 [Malaclemys terrapin pileata]
MWIRACREIDVRKWGLPRPGMLPSPLRHLPPAAAAPRIGPPAAGREAEQTLRLETTPDLAERRQIRSAIRELRRQELERDEEALASKRFRSERGSRRQENKENWLRSQRLEEEQQKSLALLSGKLDSITDVEELTALLRGADEYEERKLIRAAIRKLRANEIEAAASAGRAHNSRKGEKEPLASKGKESSDGGSSPAQLEDLEERERIRAQIRELRSEQRGEPHKPDAQDPASGTLLLLDPLHPPCCSSSLELEPQRRAEPPERSSQSPEPGPGAEQPCTQEGAGEGLGQPEAGGSGEPSQGGPEHQETPATTGDSCPVEETRRRLPSDGNQNSQVSICVKSQVPEKPASSANKTTRAAPTHDVPGPPARQDLHRYAHMPSAPYSPLPARSTEPAREQPFQRANSVRERVRKFTSDSLAQPGPRSCSQKWESPGKGSWVLQQQLLRPQGACGSQAASAQRTADLPSGPRCGLSPAPPGHAALRGAKEGSGGPPASSRAEHHTSSSEAQAAMAGGPACPKEEGSSVGRSQAGQSQGGRLTSPQRPIENAEGSSSGTEEPGAQHAASLPSCPAQPQPPACGTKASARDEDTMKTLFTIEIKDGRAQPVSNRIVGVPGSQRAELTLGLRSSPIRISSSSTASGTGRVSTASKMEAELVERPQVPVPEPELPNGMEKAQAREPEKRNKLSAEELSRIEEEDVLDKMLDQTSDFEERRLIRSAMRELRQRKREQRDKERGQRLEEVKSQAAAGKTGHATETTTRQSAQSADGSARHTLTKTEHLVQSKDGTKTSRMTTVESSYTKRSDNGSTFVQTKSSYSSSSKKVGSIFDREDESSSRQGSLAALERRQAEKKKELLKAQILPKTSATQARKAMIEKLEKESGSPSSPAMSRVAVQRSSSFGVPNANSIKQMLLDWCRAKTRGYEHVDIQNFSSSWSDGMAFCALVHNFFPEAFDYTQLTPQNRRRNFEVAFSSAEKHADCPQLLDVEDMVRMREPDWKCVYTYIQEFYRCLVQKGLVKTKKS